LVVGLLWAWWDARNKANAGEQRRLTEEVLFRARSVICRERNLQRFGQHQD
jgi:hypothetical protein